MWLQRVLAARKYSSPRPSLTRIVSYSSNSAPNKRRYPPPRQPASSTATILEPQDHEQPPTLYPSTAVNCCPWREMPYKKRKSRALRPDQNLADEKMGPPVVHIPGLTLLSNNTAASHAMPGGHPSSWPIAPPTGPRKGRQSKHALRKEAQALAAAAAAPPPQPSLQQHHQFQYVRPSSSSRDKRANVDNYFFRPNTTTTTTPNGSRTPSTPLGRDARLLPSQESGGVPDPTPLYLAQSLAPPVLRPDPRRILVIMDLNGTLLYRPNKRNPFNFIERPHARRFLSYCIDTFHVAVWSSARPENVLKMVAQLLSPSQRAKCVVTWARDKFGLCPADYDSRVQCYKRLTTIWSDPKVITSHPAAARGERWDQTNTVLVDDSMEKGRSEPHNILQIPEFAGLQGEPRDVLPQVHDYLNALCYQADVSRYMRQTPFRLDVNYKLQPPPAE